MRASARSLEGGGVGLVRRLALLEELRERDDAGSRRRVEPDDVLQSRLDLGRRFAGREDLLRLLVARHERDGRAGVPAGGTRPGRRPSSGRPERGRRRSTGRRSRRSAHSGRFSERSATRPPGLTPSPSRAQATALTVSMNCAVEIGVQVPDFFARSRSGFGVFSRFLKMSTSVRGVMTRALRNVMPGSRIIVIPPWRSRFRCCPCLRWPASVSPPGRAGRSPTARRPARGPAHRRRDSDRSLLPLHAIDGAVLLHRHREAPQGGGREAARRRGSRLHPEAG